MRCISLWQPWASVVALGLKRIETRHWSTNYTGRLAIHAAKRWTGDERDTAAMFAGLYDLRLAAPPLGAIVATVRLVRCDRSEDILRRGIGEMEEAFGNYGRSRFGWILDDIVMLEEPLPFRGMQGLFDVPDDLLAQAGKGGAVVMGELLTGVTEPSGLIIAAAASASAAVTDLVEASRGTMDLAFNLRNREIAENLTDALQSVCSIELEADDLEPERREAIGDLLAAASRFIEGWA